MAWTSPRTWVVSEVVTAALMNTHVRDNLLYLKATPLLSEVSIAAGTANTTATAGTTVTAMTTGAIAVPSDWGAVYVEAWGRYHVSSLGAGIVNWSMEIKEAAADVVARVSWNDSGSSPRQPPNAPFYMKTPDLAYAGTTRTFTLQITASNTSAALCTGTVAGSGYVNVPAYLRVLRAF